MEPGDIIITGTPPGVALGMKPPQFLKVGDVVTLGFRAWASKGRRSSRRNSLTGGQLASPTGRPRESGDPALARHSGARALAREPGIQSYASQRVNFRQSGRDTACISCLIRMGKVDCGPSLENFAAFAPTGNQWRACVAPSMRSSERDSVLHSPLRNRLGHRPTSSRSPIK